MSIRFLLFLLFFAALRLRASQNPFESSTYKKGVGYGNPTYGSAGVIGNTPVGAVSLPRLARTIRMSLLQIFINAGWPLKTADLMIRLR